MRAFGSRLYLLIFLDECFGVLDLSLQILLDALTEIYRRQIVLNDCAEGREQFLRMCLH
jgi:hypothetical protein